ncbi:MAG: AlpA family phage regulatory protein [Planctomycetota bacterium]
MPRECPARIFPPARGVEADWPARARILPNCMNTKTCFNQTGLAPMLVDARGLAGLLSLSRATVFAMHSQGKLPLPVRPTQRAPRWRVDEIRAWLAAGCPDRTTWEKSKTGR